MEAASLAFFPQQERHDEDRDGDDFKSRQRPLIAHMPSQQELNCIGWRGDENPKLIREPRNQTARLVRRKLAQVNGNDSPCALYAGLLL